MSRPAPATPLWTVLAAGAMACVLAAAAVPGSRAQLTVVAAGLGTAAIAAYGTARTQAGLPCAAVAWLAAGCIAGAAAWGLGREYAFAYALAGFQLLIGAALLPGHLRRSARQTDAARAPDNR